MKTCPVCTSTVRSPMNRRWAIARLDSPSAISTSTSRLAFAELAERVDAAPSGHQLAHDEWVDHAFPRSDAAQGVGEGRYVEDPFLHEVPHRPGLVLEQRQDEVDLDVLAQDHHGRARPPLADHRRRAQALVRVRRWHADVEQHDVRCMKVDER